MRIQRKLHILAISLAFSSAASSSLFSSGVLDSFARAKDTPDSGRKTDIYKMPNAQAQYLKHHQPERK
tara:strand:+ start:60505 stop:60708 length:204 start_codon:yes stop_codon:yes gene_type:complete